jgi:IQ domain-containing protein H
MRIFSVKDPNVDVVYISPFTLTSEVFKYYMKILELVEIEEPAKRFHLVVPENYVRFHEHLSLTQCMLYSPKALRQIQNLIDGKHAYIVPGKVGDNDVKLSI